jgi:ribosome-associated protein
MDRSSPAGGRCTSSRPEARRRNGNGRPVAPWTSPGEIRHAMVSRRADPPADALVVDASHAIPRSELSARATRSGGAGGQHVNTSSTRVELLWNPSTSRVLTPEESARVVARLENRVDAEGNIRVVASDTRSQTQNRVLAETRLAELVRRALLVPRKRRKTRPSKRARENRLQAKKETSEKKAGRRRPDWE